MAVDQLTDKQLQLKLVVIFQEWPLYRVLDYTGADGVITVPKYLTLYCQNCGKDTFWETEIFGTSNNRVGFDEKKYLCRNCATSSVRYYFYWFKGKERYEFFKVGQYPELEERVSHALETALNPDDLKTYKNAIRLRNFNLGLPALAYMRRIVENRMN